MNKCKRCGEPSQGTLCLDCEYRDGRKLANTPTARQGDRDTVDYFRRPHWRAGFTSDQLQQVSPSER